MDEYVTTGQAIILITTTRIAIAVSTMPTVNLPPYNQDIWFMNLLSIVYTLIMFFPLLFLANKYNDFSLTEYLRILYGKNIGTMITVLYGLYFLMNSVNGLTILTELTTSTVLVQESSFNIVIFLLVVMFYFVTKGIVSTARSFQLLAPVAILIISVLIIFGLNNVDFSIIKPILKDSSFLDINKGALILSLFFTDIFLLLMIVPDLKEKNKINKIAIVTVTISIACLALIVIITQGALGIQQTRHSNASFLLYVRLIDAFDLFERIDSIFVASWLITSIGRCTVFLYIATKAFRELFNKKEDDRIILGIVTIVIGVVTLLIVSNRSVIGIRREFDLFYDILFVVFALIIPIITCIIHFFRRKTLKIKDSKTN